MFGDEAETEPTEQEWTFTREDMDVPEPQWLRPNPPTDEALLAHPHFYPFPQSTGSEESEE